MRMVYLFVSGCLLVSMRVNARRGLVLFIISGGFAVVRTGLLSFCATDIAGISTDKMAKKTDLITLAING